MNKSETSPGVFPEIKVLLYEVDEALKNLFSRFFEKSRINFKFSKDFKDLIKDFRTRQFKACFIDIDLNIREDDLERFI
jgi:DNA-binding response OmpR family regulator